MIFAAIGSIDGNERALERVLTAIAEEGIHTILHTGNAVAGGTGGDAVMALLERHNVICAQGNTDKLVVRYSRKRESLERKVDPDLLAAVRAAHESLASQNLERIRDWRKTHRIPLEHLTGMLCHGSPGNPREILAAGTPAVKMQRQREIAGADIIVCGGAAEPFSRFIDGALFVATAPLVDAAGAARYTLINTEDSPWTTTMKTLPA